MKTAMLKLLPYLILPLATLPASAPLHAQASKEEIVDLSKVPQLSESPAQRDARMLWWRDAKFGMFLHWGPVSLSGKELGWGRNANRPWDINKHGPRTEDPEYDSLYKRFNPVKFDADAWVRIAQDAGMKYMVLITKHHDGFSMFDSKLTEYDIMAALYGKDIVRQFADACHKAGMKLGLYYSTRDWYHPDYLVGDNRKFDTWYRGQIEELLTNYGKVDMMWFDHVGGRDWGKWRFDELFALMYRLQPQLLVNNRAARFCGPASPEDRGPATPEIRKITNGDFGTPEQSIGHMDLRNDWESCMTLVGGQWSWKPDGKMYTFEETLKMLLDCVTGGGNLLLNIGPMPTGEIEPRQVDLLLQIGKWLKPHGEAVFGTRGGPFANGRWGGSTHRANAVYLHVFECPGETLRLSPLPQKVTGARLIPGREKVEFSQGDRGIDISVPAARRDPTCTVVELALDRPVEPGQQVGTLRSIFEDAATYGSRVSDQATFTMSSPSAHDAPADHPKLFAGERSARGYAFHTGDEANPWIRIDIGRVLAVTGVAIENRPGERRTQGLALSVSEDGTAWTPVWKAKVAADRWDVPVTQKVAGADVPGRPARYLKLETSPSRPSPLILQRVEVYGK
jgi:alpha-L-fucosidase